MDSDSWLPIVSILSLMLVACYFATAETALASANRIRIKSLADDGNRRAQKTVALLDDFDRALTTLLVGYKSALKLYRMGRIEADPAAVLRLDKAILHEAPYISDYI